MYDVNVCCRARDNHEQKLPTWLIPLAIITTTINTTTSITTITSTTTTPTTAAAIIPIIIILIKDKKEIKSFLVIMYVLNAG